MNAIIYMHIYIYVLNGARVSPIWPSHDDWSEEHRGGCEATCIFADSQRNMAEDSHAWKHDMGSIKTYNLQHPQKVDYNYFSTSRESLMKILYKECKSPKKHIDYFQSGFAWRWHVIPHLRDSVGKLRHLSGYASWWHLARTFRSSKRTHWVV